MKKKLLTLIAATAVMAVTFLTPVFAAGNTNPPADYSTYSSYEDYVKSLLEDGLITQKGADELLEGYNTGNYGGGYGRCGGYGGGCGYGRTGYGR